ncbi:MAG: C40 family peptidase [Eubacteriales bacterium]|nr:C40 family peptidase [Eubacteriales bacterium]
MMKHRTKTILAAMTMALLSLTQTAYATELTDGSSTELTTMSVLTNTDTNTDSTANTISSMDAATSDASDTEDLLDSENQSDSVNQSNSEDLLTSEASDEINSTSTTNTEEDEEAKRLAARQEIVDFALQFVGNPYVWGGTSLTNGADCSGFVLAVMENFDISLPRTAAEQYNASEKVDLSEIEVGDLIFYGNGISHVALYMGDGKIVHASNSSTGIIVSDIDYMTPVAAGTYVK